MFFLINASNLKNGGGLQVAQSICEQLNQYQHHRFIIVLSTYINDEHISSGVNVEVYKYNIPHNIKSILFGRDAFLDGLVSDKNVNAVLTVFGPSLWRPRCPHLCGFARAQLLKEVNPDVHPNIKERLVYKVWRWGFRKSSKVFYTENPYISGMLPQLIKGAKVYTVSNYYNQVFDHPEQWKRTVVLDDCRNNKEKVTMLTISSTGAHKNLGIMVPVAEYLEQVHRDFNFRFVLTCDKAPFRLPEHLGKHFLFVGKVDVSECPNLYEQADVMFMPTLMECFTATYVEAMRMEVPIVTTNLVFAHGLCGDAACYYSSMDAHAAAEAIYKVATNREYAQQLVSAGKEQLKKFDDYKRRAEKLINILVEIS